MRRCKKYFLAALASAVVWSALSGCAATGNFARIEQPLVSGDYDGAYGRFLAEKDSLYSKSKDEVLMNLDEGLLLHYTGDSEGSNRKFSEAEKAIQAARTKSISEAVGSAVVNDSVRTYSGELYEDIYTNIFMCLNYLAQNQEEDAFVEIRRFDEKLKLALRNSAAQAAEAKSALGSHADKVPDAAVTFYSSALAHYLSLLMYRADGNADDARIDYNAVQTAFRTQAQIYDFTIPNSIDEEMNVPAGKARLNVLSWTGLAPVKTAGEIRVMLPQTYYKLSLPEMRKRGSGVRRIAVKVISADGASAATELEKIESVENIAVDTFKANYSAIFARTLARSITKAAATAASGEVGSRLSDSDNGYAATAGLILNIFSSLSRLGTELSEQADTRTSRFFPADAYVGGITLEPGTYDVAITYYGAGGAVLGTRTYTDVRVRKDAVNLVEGICVAKIPDAPSARPKRSGKP